MRRKVFIFFLAAFLLFTVFIATPKITSFQYNPLGALIAGFFPSWQKNQPPILSEEIPEQYSLQEANTNSGTGQDEDVLVEKIDDLEDQIDILSQRISEMEKQIQLLNEENLMAQEEEEDVEEELSEEEGKEDELAKEEVGQDVGQEPCERIQEVQPAKNKIIFNEIAWMGTSSSSNAEWVELKNISGKPLDFSGWQILNKNNQIKIIFSENYRSATPVISVAGFWLLERTSDDVVPGVLADLIYTGALRNSDEALYLFDENCQFQDEAIAGTDWPAGDNSSKRTMERRSDFTWQTSLNPGGTPKADNSSGYVVVVPSSGGGGGGGGGGAPPVIYPKILITEVGISPIDERFVELYNPNNQIVNLTDWYIQRKIENGEPSTFISSPNFEGKIIGPSDYFLITHSSSTATAGADILLQLTLTQNNTLLLKNPKGEITDEINWGDVLEGFSYGRIWDDLVNNYSDNFEILDSTPKEKNKPKTNQPPIASFTFSPQSPLVDNLVTFDASSSTDSDGQIISYIWDFGDTNTATAVQASTTHSYATSTEFIIGLQVIDNEDAVSALATSTIFVAELEAPFLQLDVVINEIAWMGTDSGGDYEWIELYNNKEEKIDISGWKIENAGAGNKTLEISAEEIPPKDFFLICKKTIENCKLISGALSLHNEYEKNGKLVLKDNFSNIIDQTPEPAGKNWPAGDNTTKKTMERINPADLGNKAENWSNSQNPEGTPKTQNSVYQQP